MTSFVFNSRASALSHQKPALCRVASYCAPGLPRPTKSLIMQGVGKRKTGGTARLLQSRPALLGTLQDYFLPAGFLSAAGAVLPVVLVAAAGAAVAAPAPAPATAVAAGEAAAVAAAATSAAAASSVMASSSAAPMITTETRTGLFSWRVTAVTPLGKVMSARCSEAPFFRPLKSTLINSGRSAGRHSTSISLTT